MNLEVDHSTYFDWELTHANDVKPEDVSVPSHHGEKFRLVRQHRDEPNTTSIMVPDADWDQSYEDHRKGVATASRGYTTTQTGGPDDGKSVEVAPRHLPLYSKNRLLVKHLQEAVFPAHFPGEHVTAVRVTGPHFAHDEKERKKLEKYLNRVLVESPEEEE